MCSRDHQTVGGRYLRKHKVGISWYWYRYQNFLLAMQGSWNIFFAICFYSVDHDKTQDNIFCFLIDLGQINFFFFNELPKVSSKWKSIIIYIIQVYTHSCLKKVPCAKIKKATKTTKSNSNINIMSRTKNPKKYLSWHTDICEKQIAGVLFFLPEFAGRLIKKLQLK